MIVCVARQAFYTRWWNEASADEQQRMVKLFQNKQLDFANGGWCMYVQRFSIPPIVTRGTVCIPCLCVD